MATIEKSPGAQDGADPLAMSPVTALFAPLLRLAPAEAGAMAEKLLAGVPNPLARPEDAARWGEMLARVQRMWGDFQAESGMELAGDMQGLMAPWTVPGADMLSGTMPFQWAPMFAEWSSVMPLAKPEVQQQLWQDGLALWQGVLGQGTADGHPSLPRSDRRFADPRWRDQPLFALIHQTYLLLAEQLTRLADEVTGLEPARKEQLRFATRLMIEALSPDHFMLTNPIVMEQAIKTGGQSLVHGMEHLIADLRKKKLTHTDPQAFRLGENIASTPGKVVHETPLYQLIQYTPTTDKVLETPLVIFPPWINRFYILDLNPAKSFVRWAVEQGITVFMVSWKSADATMAEVTWDDYIGAQVGAIDHVRARLKVPSVHTIGYCVAGTTLAATLAVLGARGEADKVASATFFTAQVDFERAGDLKNFIDDTQLAALEKLGTDGYLDGRYLAAAFNLLRSNDLIWSYVLNNYLLGQDYPAFDLLHWNGDTTNLPARWHLDYLRDLYRDNRLVQPGSLAALDTPIDLGKIETPCYIQAGREDHIAPMDSVWRFTRHLKGEWTYLLAGSGHIAGVVNPPASGKYQYWTNPERVDTLDAFIAGATETKGSWWPHWLGWIRERTPAEVAAKGKRVPGGRGDKAIEDAPGRYVRTA